MKHGKKYQDSVKAYDLGKQYEAAEAVSILLEAACSMIAGTARSMGIVVEG